MRLRRFSWIVAAAGLVVLGSWGLAWAEERMERFDRDPGWDGHNHRSAVPRELRQDFGYSQTSHAGGKRGEIGGFISPAGEAAYYAAKIPKATFDEPLSAAGKLACGDEPFHVLVGFFHADALNEWRTPNTIALRLIGRGNRFFAYVEYCTSRWRAGGDHPQSFPMTEDAASGRLEPVGFAAGKSHRWSLHYDPAGNEGRGAITATIDETRAVCHLEEGHRLDGARFNRFGLLTVMKSADTGGHVWLDDVEVSGTQFDFAADPGWDAVGNRRTYQTTIVRPAFDFGFSATHFAGGQAEGELGGIVFRGDCRYPERMAYYADRLEPLSLERPLRAAGKVALRRGVSDSTVLLGFFDARRSTTSNPAQNAGLPASFLGISTDGPSRDGFCFWPTYRLGTDSGTVAAENRPALLPDGISHDWSFRYAPDDGQHGAVTLSLDRRTVRLPLTAEARSSGTQFDRFGIITTWIDGNSQTIYFDDLSYTFRQEQRSALD